MRTMLMLNPMGWSSDISLMGMKEWSDLRNDLVYLGADVISPKWKTTRSPDFSSEAVIVDNVAVVHESNTEMINFLSSHRVKVYPCEFNFSAADVIVSADKTSMWAAISKRTSIEAIIFLEKVFSSTDVRRLQLYNNKLEVQPESFALNQCMNILPNSELVFYPDMFCEQSLYILETWFKNRIQVSSSDFVAQGCSLVSMGNTLLIPQVSTHLVSKLTNLGYNVKVQNIDSFVDKKFGCKSLLLDMIE